MKRKRIIVMTLAALTASAWLLPRAGGLSRPAQAAPAEGSCSDATLSTARNYFQNGARHWRNCLLTAP